MSTKAQNNYFSVSNFEQKKFFFRFVWKIFEREGEKKIETADRERQRESRRESKNLSSERISIQSQQIQVESIDVR